MPYGSIKVDTLTFTNAGVDKSVSISGLVQNPTFTGNVTVTGTVSGTTVRATTVSGVTVSGTTANFASAVFSTQINSPLHIASGGSAAAPSIQIGTGASIAPGLYSPGTDRLGISTGGSFRLVVDSVGNVGIGTSSPAERLEISATTDPKIRFTDVANTDAKIGIVGSTALGFEVNGSERMRIDSSGRVGIGTSSPGAILHTTATSAGAATIGAYLQNSSLTAGTEIRLAFGPNTNLVSDNRYAWIGALNVAGSNDSALTFATAPGGAPGAERMRIDSSGQLIIAEKANGLTNGVIFNVPYTGGQANGISQCLQVAGTGNVNALARINMSTNDLASNNSSYISFATSPGGAGAPSGELATERMRIDPSGNVGIGTLNPTSLLHLGDSGNITVGTTTGTKIGTATTQKIGFYNATPVVQPTAVANATDAASVITQLNALLARMRDLGLIAT